MTPQRLDELTAIYRDGLLNDTVPFWQKHSPDRECGGFLTFLDADGSVVGTDKPIWVAGRATWLFSTLYNRVQRKPEWLELTAHGIDFLRRYAFDADGRMFILYFRDCKAKPCEQYEHDTKLWWPHNEAIYATLLAHHLTGAAH